ncbi:Arginase/deacetylase [Hygrophoropsis aurantiaca]|uniref:Arginase/deacetylase n=1 Tax=Hygrophoropsis aurantiaca TaxID=72124 RepID=A0ACB8ANZ8_9AGAM|nr:Arginase/deacetylase [Hygrophoropsis aurantiaca]
MNVLLFTAITLVSVSAHQHVLIDTPNQQEPWAAKYGGQVDLSFSGPLSYSHLPYARCLDDPSTAFDIAILGMPFDTATTYRPGARFGPSAIRLGSRRQSAQGGYALNWMTNPYLSAKIIDCGDVPVSPFDNALAIDQIATAYTTLLNRPSAGDDVQGSLTGRLAKDGVDHPRIVTLGGDHTIVWPILRSLHQVYGPISVIHFDAHIDTWPTLASNASEQSRVTHGTFFTLAFEEGLMSNTSIHAGIRNKLQGPELIEHDEAVGFELIMADDIDDFGTDALIRKIRTRVGNSPVYLSFDIDTIDPGQAPATGTPEPAGWTSRETKRILRGLAGLNFVGADIVEVAPAYDNADITGILAAGLVDDFLTLFVQDEPPKRRTTEFNHGARDDL